MLSHQKSESDSQMLIPRGQAYIILDRRSGHLYDEDDALPMQQSDSLVC